MKRPSILLWKEGAVNQEPISTAWRHQALLHCLLFSSIDINMFLIYLYTFSAPPGLAWLSAGDAGSPWPEPPSVLLGEPGSIRPLWDEVNWLQHGPNLSIPPCTRWLPTLPGLSLWEGNKWDGNRLEKHLHFGAWPLSGLECRVAVWKARASQLEDRGQGMQRWRSSPPGPRPPALPQWARPASPSLSPGSRTTWLSPAHTADPRTVQSLRLELVLGCRS